MHSVRKYAPAVAHTCLIMLLAIKVGLFDGLGSESRTIYQQLVKLLENALAS